MKLIKHSPRSYSCALCNLKLKYPGLGYPIRMRKCPGCGLTIMLPEPNTRWIRDNRRGYRYGR